MFRLIKGIGEGDAMLPQECDVPDWVGPQLRLQGAAEPAGFLGTSDQKPPLFGQGAQAHSHHHFDDLPLSPPALQHHKPSLSAKGIPAFWGGQKDLT